ncbi:hypothetical protein AB4Z52_25835 [Rhizobium sp. 2YAF20]|uniref:hypothetical protein n=1 Tax=Rhizobium sp. 2YAF20 TaxID=3233027 RepID=UPI003F99F3E2
MADFRRAGNHDIDLARAIKDHLEDVTMPSRRGFLLSFAFGVLVAAPYQPMFKAHFLEFALDMVIAKDGNSGNAGNGNGNSGNGNGNAGSGSGSAGNGNSGNGNGGSDNGNGKGNSFSGSVGSNNDSSGKNNDTDSNGGTKGSAASHIGADGSIDVQHPDGLSERIQNGRYVMKDSKGRTIINRLASKADESRLRSFIH